MGDLALKLCFKENFFANKNWLVESEGKDKLVLASRIKPERYI